MINMKCDGSAFLKEIIRWFDVIIALKMKGKANTLLSA